MATASPSFVPRLHAGLALLLGLAVPTSTALLNVVLILCLVAALVRPDVAALKALARRPVVWLPALLFALLALSLLFHDNAYGPRAVDKYKRLLFVLPLALFFLKDPALLPRRFCQGFLAACAVTLLITLASGLSGIAIGSIDPANPTPFKTHIAQNFFMALAALGWLALATHPAAGRLRPVHAVLALLAAVSILLLVLGRTGYIALAAGIGAWIAASQPPRRLVVAVVAGTLLVVALFTIPNRASERMLLGVQEIQRCLDADGQAVLMACESSMGQRTAFARTSLRLIQDAPWFGQGAGAFHYANPETGYQVNNPHNEYLNQAVAGGLVGLAILLAWLASAYRASWTLERPQRNLAVGVLTAYAAGMLFNSLLLDAAEGHLFVIVIALIAALSPSRALTVRHTPVPPHRVPSP